MKNFDQIFNDSYERIIYRGDQGDAFFSLFYELFITSSPAVADMFLGVDLTKQKLMLQRSLYLAMDFSSTRIETQAIKKYADVHGPLQRNVPADMYVLWLDALIKAVKAHDPRFNEDVELAWKLVLSPLILYLSAHSR
ncbi:globin [Motilimonas sp. E26]|uniref:globin n=1 Tax=Motilimonas sp. E26 TaxID=2865674 RepID=UPI001E474C33|nr:globin [Motilimonas sp. E26]MCE0559296.1 globin [Motilimonas sp. E26]